MAGELTAIAHAVLNPVHIGTRQDRTGAAQQPLLGGQFFFSLQAYSRAAAGAGSQQVKFTDIAIDSAGSGWQDSTSLILRNDPWGMTGKSFVK